MTNRRIKTLGEQLARVCVHFSGLSQDKCKAGVVYLTVRATDTPPTRKGMQYPCFAECQDLPCDKRRFRTAEEVAAEVAEHEKSSADMRLAMEAVGEEAKAKGLGEGNGGRGSVPCPVCKVGKLHFSVASLNGHIWGKCDTPNCVYWMM